MQLEGEWISTKNGEKIIVRNSVIDGDNMILVTNKGNIPMTVFSNNYVKLASNKEYDIAGNEKSVVDNQSYDKLDDHHITLKDNPVKSNSGLSVIDMSDFYIPRDAQLDNQEVSTLENNEEVVGEDPVILSRYAPADPDSFSIISKVFDKFEAKPNIIVNIEWDEFPKEQLATLVDFLDIPVEDITNYIYKYVIKDEDIKFKIRCMLETKLGKKSIQ